MYFSRLGLCMRMMPRAALSQCALRMWVGHVELRFQKLVRAREQLRLNRASKVSIIYTWLVKTLHNVFSSFALFLVLFLPSQLLLYIDFVTFSFSMSPTVGCIQYSTPQNTYVAEDQPRCPGHSIVKKHRSSLSSIARQGKAYQCIQYPRESVHVTQEFIYVHVSAN